MTQRVNDQNSGAQGFRRMLTLQAFHAGGDAFIAIALAGTLFFSVPLGQARGRIGLYLAITMAPFAVLSPIVGPMLDRRRGSWRAASLVACVGRAGIALVMAPRTDTISLYPLAFVLLVLSRTYGVSRAGIVPSLTPPTRSLLWANARLSIISVAAGMLAGTLGIVVQKLGGSDWTLRIAAMIFVCGAIAAMRIPTGSAAPRTGTRGSSSQRTLLSPRLLAGGALVATTRAVLGFVVFFLAFALRRQGHGSGAFAAVLIVAALGALVGSFVVPALRRLSHEPVLILAAVGTLGATAFVLSSGFGIPTALAMGAVTGLCTTGARLGFDSLVQRDAPEHVRGRTFARYETIFQLAWVAGAALATAVPFGSRPGLRVVTVMCLIGVVIAVRGAMDRGAVEPGDGVR